MTISTSMVPGFRGPDFAALRETFADLQQQLASGRKADTFGGLGDARFASLDHRASLATIASFKQTIDITDTRVKILDASLTGVDDLASTVRKAMAVGDFTLNDGKAQGQLTSRNSFDQMIALMNADVGGRYLFGGRKIDTPPVLQAGEILAGKGGKDGFNRVLRERMQADLGSSAPTPERDATATGRLALSAPAVQPVTLAEDGVHGFGLKIAGVSGVVGGVSASFAGGPPSSVSIAAAAGQASTGETLQIRFTLPDGTEADIALTAGLQPTGASNRGRFAIGATAGETLTNLRAALGEEMQRLVSGKLAAASAAKAGDDFFTGETNAAALAGPPAIEPGVAKRLVPGASGTMRDAVAYDTAQNAENRTVRWYVGDRGGTDARATATARIDRTITVSYGSRADEPGLRNAIQAFAVGASLTYDAADPHARDRNVALSERVIDGLSREGRLAGVITARIEIAATQTAIAATRERHARAEGMLSGMLEEAEGVKTEVVAAQMLSVQNRLQASYQTTAMLSRLSLVQYL